MILPKISFYVVPAWCGTANTSVHGRKEVCSFGTIDNEFINHRTAFAIWHINNAKKERGYIVRFLWLGARIVLPRNKT